MFEIKLDKHPKQFLSKCEDILFERISKKIENFKTNPVTPDAKRVLGYELPTFRIRTGKHCTLYRANYEEKKYYCCKN